MERGMHLFPKQGDRDPWRNTQNYILDKATIRNAPIEDGILDFSDGPAVVPRSAAYKPEVKTVA
jgi:hypothetical protein